jgi:NAD(P)-dependent dehydrogenase (short-subunit alcohol dehydrogenase family)
MKIAAGAVLVTGANRGVGQALVEGAVRRGSKRVNAGTRQPLAHWDGRVPPLTLDVTNTAQIQAAVEAVESLDVLINNAGLALYDDDLSERAIVERHLAVYLFGTLSVTQAFLRLLTRSRGAIVNVLSVAAFGGRPAGRARCERACRPDQPRGHGHAPQLGHTEVLSGVRCASHLQRGRESGRGSLSRSHVSVHGGELAQWCGQGARVPVRGVCTSRALHVMSNARDAVQLRHAALAATLGLAAAAWVVAIRQMNGMDMGVATRLGSFVFFVALWVSMMAAMMLPGAAPAVVRRAHASGRVRAVPLFVGSYLAVWTLVGVAVYALYRPHGSFAAGAVVIAAGVYELTPLKQRFRRRCREIVRSGFEFGLCCVGSSIGLMLMLVALGVMSLTWMSVIAVLVLAQKLLPTRAAIDVPLALAIVGLGLLIVFAPSSVPGLVPPM